MLRARKEIHPDRTSRSALLRSIRRDVRQRPLRAERSMKATGRVSAAHGVRVGRAASERCLICGEGTRRSRCTIAAADAVGSTAAASAALLSATRRVMAWHRVPASSGGPLRPAAWVCRSQRADRAGAGALAHLGSLDGQPPPGRDARVTATRALRRTRDGIPRDAWAVPIHLPAGGGRAAVDRPGGKGVQARRGSMPDACPEIDAVGR